MRIHLGCAAALAVALAACSGDNGAAGTDGDSGEPGATGANGKNGENGTNGAKGATGAKGDDGANGAKGDDGATGAKGTNGDTGDTGAKGDTGDDIILSETARLGLELSAVDVDLDGLDGDAIESVGRGSYLVNAVADCVGCHNGTGTQGETLFLAGNVEFPFPPIGWDSNHAPCNSPGTTGCDSTVVYTRNLTPDPTTGLKLTEDQFVTVLRTGRDFKDATGASSLLVMPWPQLRWMTERDMRDIYRYLTHIPAVDNAVQGDKKPKIAPLKYPYLKDSDSSVLDVPTFKDGDVDRALPAALDFEATPPRPTAAAGELFDTNNVLRGLAISPLADDGIVTGLSASEQALYGRGSYIVNGPGLCNECHTPGGRDENGKVRTAIFLTGGQAFAVPPPVRPLVGQVRAMSANLIGKDHGFKLVFSMFLNTLASGASFSKGTPHPLGFPMPFDTFRNMTTADKEAVYTYITTLQKNDVITGDAAHQAPARLCATAVADCNAGETCEMISVFAANDTKECAGADCSANGDADCGACQKCDTGNTDKCLKEDPNSNCVKFSF